jgi:hypothetical protein
MRRVSVALVLLVGLSLLGGPTGSSTAGSAPGERQAAGPASYGFLKAQVFDVPGRGQLAVGMPNARTVKVQHRLTAGDWSRPRVLFRKKGVTCGEVDGRASAGGVALLLECDTPYYEDQAPVHSMAFVTRDLRTWASTRLRGEAYQDSAISASGNHAAWLFGGHGHYKLWSADGFRDAQTSFDYDSGGETIVVDDAGTVTVMGPDGTGTGCELGVWDRPLAGPEDHYVIEGIDPGCTEGGVENVDDRTVVGAGPREQRFTIGREPGERWRLTRAAPADAPSLVRYAGPRTRVIRNQFSDATGQSLVSVGGPDRKHVFAQVYDDFSGTWGAPALVVRRASGGCGPSPTGFTERLPRMHVVGLRCAGRATLLTSHDSVSWTVTRLDRRPYAFSGNGALLAVPGPRSTTLVSRRGTTRLPVRAPGRCDFVFPIGRDAVLRLHGGPGSRWPTKVQISVAGARWRTVQTIAMPRSGSCAKVIAQQYDLPTWFFLEGGGHGVSLRVRRGGPGGWHVARENY